MIFYKNQKDEFKVICYIVENYPNIKIGSEIELKLKTENILASVITELNKLSICVSYDELRMLIRKVLICKKQTNEGIVL